ncbi:MAG: crossover junction endodeoxyribonuclease RuvC [Candidatus Paceibacteria bacterium]|jgi:crossover junction endodeoxyribonuclease RuvC
MKILGIDPGYERVGIAIIEKEDGKENLLYSDCFKTSAKLPHEERLALISGKIESVIVQYSPDALAIEKLFFGSNQKTAMKVSEARGVVINECSSRGMKVFEYTPIQIKVAVTGYGRSDKAGVIKMVPNLIKINKEIKYDDEYDAIATGLTFFASEKFIHKK